MYRAPWWPADHVPERRLAAHAWLARRGDGTRVVVKAGAAHPVLATLRHPHLASIIAGGGDWHAAAFVEGRTLAAHLADGAVPQAVALRWMDQLLAALDHLHAHGLVHRDVQAANVIIDAAENAVLIDFGLAGAIGPCAVQGTPASTAPEQWRGHAGPGSDVFGAGVLLYRMLAGCHPFPGTPFEAMQRILLSNYRLHFGLHFAPLETVTGVVEKALAADPARRFADAASFRRALANG